MMCAILFNPKFQTKLKNFSRCEQYIIIVDLEHTTWNSDNIFAQMEKLFFSDEIFDKVIFVITSTKRLRSESIREKHPQLNNKVTATSDNLCRIFIISIRKGRYCSLENDGIITLE